MLTMNFIQVENFYVADVHAFHSEIYMCTHSDNGNMEIISQMHQSSLIILM